MIKRTITLSDGEHEVCTPTFYALQMMTENGVDFDGGVGYSDISGMVAALLTDSEPLDAKGYPSKFWTPPMAAKVIDPSSIATVMETVTELLNDAFPAPKGDKKDERPTKAPAS